MSQPLDATGGNDREGLASLKANGPRSVLALERAVSLTDFGALASSQASVWQARAFAVPATRGRNASVEVVVVPAGGGPLGELAADVASTLRSSAPPGIDVGVSAYEPEPLDVEVEIEVKSAEFDPDKVRKAVDAALRDRFGLRCRALGASLFVSELYAVVEGVTGVESSRVRIGVAGLGPGDERVLRAADRQVIFVDPARSQISITVREFEL